MATDAVGLRDMDSLEREREDGAPGAFRSDKPLSARQAAIVWVVSALVGWSFTVAVVWAVTQLF